MRSHQVLQRSARVMHMPKLWFQAMAQVHAPIRAFSEFRFKTLKYKPTVTVQRRLGFGHLDVISTRLALQISSSARSHFLLASDNNSQ